MELLRHLVIGGHHRHRPGRVETDLGEELREAVGKLVFGLVGVADLVVAKLKFHGAPRPVKPAQLAASESSKSLRSLPAAARGKSRDPG